MKNKKIEYWCESCGHIKYKEKNWKTRTKKYLRKTIFIFLVITSVFGTMNLYNFIAIGIYDNPDLMFNPGGIYAFIENFRSNFKSNNELKEIALNLTKDCEDDECKVKKIYDHLLTFEYEEGKEDNPLIVWNDKKGDCDELSFLFKNILLEIDISSRIQANENHAWVVVKLENKKILVDITKRIWSEYEG